MSSIREDEVTESGEGVDLAKRRLLQTAAGLGASLAVVGLCPLLGSMEPGLSAQRATEPRTIDLGAVPKTEVLTIQWAGQPIWLLYRTADMLAAVEAAVPFLADPHSRRAGSVTPAYCRNTFRSVRPEWLVLIGICTHLGCIPMEAYRNRVSASLPPDFPGGFLCPCHGSRYDLAGRVWQNMPALDNLHIPPHHYTQADQLVIGVDPKV